jgi:hypothetical protein
MSGRRQEAARRVDQPETGFFLIRLVRGGWKVPCQIARCPETSDWIAIIDGETTRHPDPTEAGVMRIWLAGESVEEWVARDRDALREWAKAHDPDHPAANPRKAVDPMRLRPVAVPRSIIPTTPGEPRE